MNHRNLLAAMLLSMPIAAFAGADDDEIRFEESVRNFGFTTGMAHQCSAPDKRPAVESQAMKAFSGLVRLFGSDQAFFYAAAFGAGTAMPVERDKCADYVASFNKAMQKHSGK